MSGKTVVVLGGGVGGQVAANALRTLLPEQHRVMLVEKDLRHAFTPSLLWVMIGGRRPEQAVRDLRTLVHRGVEVVEAKVVGLDPGPGRIETTRWPVD